jgi:hypothetical protein
MNELLLWMSARHAGSRASLRSKMAELEPSGLRAAGRYRQAEWDLSKLGHAEFGAATDGADWRVAPPVLAAGDFDETCRAVLCGARTPAILDALAAQALPGAICIKPQRSAPDAVSVTASSAADLASLAVKVGLPIQWNAPMAILMAAVPPKAQQLKKIAVPIGGWTVSRFSKTQLGWVESSVREASVAAAGLFRFRAERQATAYVLVENHEAFSCDPASAKYRILNRLRRRNRPLAYNSAARELAVLSSCRPPALIERALVVSSGALPMFRDERIIYGGVDRGTAAAVSAILAQRLG